jgi:hypothetical protein
MRRTIRFIAAASLYMFAAFSTLVAGVLIYTHAHRAEAQVSAFLSAFFDVFADGDTGKTIAAVTGAPFALSCFLGPLVFGWLLERKRKWPGSFRHGAKLHREQTGAALSASAD